MDLNQQYVDCFFQKIQARWDDIEFWEILSRKGSSRGVIDATIGRWCIWMRVRRFYRGFGGQEYILEDQIGWQGCVVGGTRDEAGWDFLADAAWVETKQERRGGDRGLASARSIVEALGRLILPLGTKGTAACCGDCEAGDRWGARSRRSGRCHRRGRCERPPRSTP